MRSSTKILSNITVQTNTSTPRHKDTLLKLLEKNLSKIEDFKITRTASVNSQYSSYPIGSPKASARDQNIMIQSQKQSLSALPMATTKSVQRCQSQILVNPKKIEPKLSPKIQYLFNKSPKHELDRIFGAREDISQFINQSVSNFSQKTGNNTDGINVESTYSLERTICQKCQKENQRIMNRINQDNFQQTQIMKERYEFQLGQMRKQISELRLQIAQQQPLSLLQTEIQRFQIEKDLYIKQHQENIQNLSRSYEIQLKDSNDEISRLENTLVNINQELLQYKKVDKTVQNLEELIQKALEQNENLSQQKEQLQQYIRSITNSRNETLNRLTELWNVQQETKLQIQHLTKIFLCIANHQVPPVDLILQKQMKYRTVFSPEKKQKSDEDLEKFIEQTMEKEEKVIHTLVSQSAEILDHISKVVIKYQENFLCDMGIHIN